MPLSTLKVNLKKDDEYDHARSDVADKVRLLLSVHGSVQANDVKLEFYLKNTISVLNLCAMNLSIFTFCPLPLLFRMHFEKSSADLASSLLST